MIDRTLKPIIVDAMDRIPVVAIVGARQVGKTTLAKSIISEIKDVLFLDLEKSSDLQMIDETEIFLELNKDKTICIDEVQIKPKLHAELRSFIDNNPNTRFIILGSSSPQLLRQSSESLAGRVYYFELSPFLWNEILDFTDMQTYRLIGGMPRSILSKNTNDAFQWIENYIKTFLERDLRSFGFNIPPERLRRFWQMLAHVNGQVINYSMLGNSLGVTHSTIKNYIDILTGTFMLRIIQPYHPNLKKRLVKAPKIYFRDTGILHSLLNIHRFEDLFVHPSYGTSWESTVVENIISKYNGWNYSYYRTAKGNEIDLVLTKANQVIAIEIKVSSTPKPGRGFWQALDDIQATEAYIIAPVRMPYPINKNVMVYPLEDFLSINIQ